MTMTIGSSWEYVILDNEIVWHYPSISAMPAIIVRVGYRGYMGRWAAGGGVYVARSPRRDVEWDLDHAATAGVCEGRVDNRACEFTAGVSA